MTLPKGMTMNKMTLAALTVLVAAMGITSALANESTTKTKDDGFWATQKEQNQEHYNKQMEENKAFMDSLIGKTEAEKKTLVEQHRATQEAENQAFMSKQHEAAIAHIQNSNLTDAAKKEKIAQLKDAWAKADAKHAEEKAKRQAEHKAKSGK